MREDRRAAPPQLKSALGVVGLLAAAVTGGLVLFTLGPGPAIIFGGSVLVAVVLTAALAGRNVATAVLGASGVLLAITSVIGLYGVAQIAVALTGGDNTPVPRPDPVLLAQANDKIDAEAASIAFRLDLTEEELNAVLQDALAEADNPFRRVTVDITNALGEDGRLEFVGEFKDGHLDVNGVLRTRVSDGRLDVEILELDVGMFTIPGVARGALEDMIADLADLQASLAREGADVQDIRIGDDRIIVTGTNRSDGSVDAAAVVAGISGRVDIGSPDPIDPVYPAGRVNTTAADGNVFYVALGDSLAANVGVEEPRDGYVSRFHGWLEQDDGQLGLRNFGIPGETSGSLLNAGQLEEAIDFGKLNFVRYVTIDIGANDLLGHLSSPDCSADLDAEACRQRIDATLEAYDANMREIFRRAARAFPDAEIIFLTTYNPFGFGFEDRVDFEATSNGILTDLNDIATEAAEDHGITVADGFTRLRGMATATTHMVDSPPDIHPNVAGYDLLTGALIAAVS